MTDLGLLVIFYKTIGNYKQELDKKKLLQNCYRGIF